MELMTKADRPEVCGLHADSHRASIHREPQRLETQLKSPMWRRACSKEPAFFPAPATWPEWPRRSWGALGNAGLGRLRRRRAARPERTGWKFGELGRASWEGGMEREERRRKREKGARSWEGGERGADWEGRPGRGGREGAGEASAARRGGRGLGDQGAPRWTRGCVEGEASEVSPQTRAGLCGRGMEPNGRERSAASPPRAFRGARSRCGERN